MKHEIFFFLKRRILSIFGHSIFLRGIKIFYVGYAETYSEKIIENVIENRHQRKFTKNRKQLGFAYHYGYCSTNTKISRKKTGKTYFIKVMSIENLTILIFAVNIRKYAKNHFTKIMVCCRIFFKNNFYQKQFFA